MNRRNPNGIKPKKRSVKIRIIWFPNECDTVRVDDLSTAGHGTTCTTRTVLVSSPAGCQAEVVYNALVVQPGTLFHASFAATTVPE